MDKIKEALVENKFLIIALLIIIAVFIGIGIYRNNVYKDQENGRNPENENQIIDTYEKQEYKANEYMVVHVNSFQLLEEYYHDYIMATIENPEEAYNHLHKTSKDKYSFEEYKKHIKRYTTINTKNNKIEQYRTNRSYNKIGNEIIDTEGNKFVFITNSIWDYEVVLLEKNK